jgi:hypothetical protein
MSKWGGTPRPTSMKAAVANKTFGPYSNVTSGVLHAFHGGHWGGWQFRIMGVDSSPGKPVACRCQHALNKHTLQWHAVMRARFLKNTTLRQWLSMIGQ